MARDSGSRAQIVAYAGSRQQRSAKRRYLIVCAGPAPEAVLRAAQTLVRHGHQVRWVVPAGGRTAHRRKGSGAGAPSELPGYRRLDAAQAGSRPRALIAGTVARLSGSRQRVRLAAKFDPWFRRAVRSVHAIIAADPGAESVLPVARHFAPEVLEFTSEMATEVLAEQTGWDNLTTAAQRLLTARPRDLRTDHEPMDAVLQALRSAPETRLLARIDADGTRALISHMAPAASPETMIGIIDAATAHPELDPAGPLLTGYRLIAELDQGATPTDRVAPTVQAVLRSADEHLQQGDLRSAAQLATVALDVLFHRDLHSDTQRSDLVDDPVGYTRVLTESDVGRLLTGSVPEPAGEAPGGPAPDHGPARIEVAVLPGPYGSTHLPVVEALQQAPRTRVRTIDLRATKGTFRSMKNDPALVRFRLDRALGRPNAAYQEERDALSGYDVLFANWADKATVLASLAAPARTRLTVRVHSVDALRASIHLVDWGRVDHLICVSPHIQDLVRELLGDRLHGTQCHVVPNVVDPARFEADKPEGAERVLCMVGWAQRVKDPLWAVQVLADLRARDPRWRLLLIGADFADNLPASGRTYAAQFRARAMHDDVREAIEYVGFTEDLPAQVRRAGFVLSGSVRESWPVGVIEAAAAGAVPVVRDWPLFARRGGARQVFPGEWVVDDVQQAVARIDGVHGQWQDTSDATREQARALTDVDGTARRLRAITIGAVAELADLVAQGRDDAAITLILQVLERGEASTAFLREAAKATLTLGAATLRYDVFDRLAEQHPNAELLATMRAQLGRLRETSPQWAPSVPDPAAPIQPVPGRVLHVLKVSMPHRESGYAVRSMYTLRAQREAGLDSVVATALDFPPDATSQTASVDDVHGVRHHRLLREHIPDSEPLDTYLNAWAARLLRATQQIRPDVIHVHSGHRGYESALVALSAGKAMGRPVVYEVRGFFESLWGARDPARTETGESYQRRRQTEERCMRAASAVVTLSETMRQDIIDRGIPPGRVHVVPNAVDPEAFPPRERDSALTQRWGLSDRFVFGYVSNLDHYREGHELLIRAAVALRDQGVPATALIVGDGHRAEELRALAGELNAGDAVVFTGRVPHEQVHDYYTLCDVFVIPRVEERAARLVTPLKPFEAMALQIPLIVSDLPALLEVTGSGKRGRAFRTGDVDSLMETLRSARANPYQTATMAARARQWVLAERTWAANARRYRDLYRSLEPASGPWPVQATDTRSAEATGLQDQILALRDRLQATGADPYPDGPARGDEDVLGLRWRRQVLRAALSGELPAAGDQQE